jgi:hypothetical protein
MAHRIDHLPYEAIPAAQATMSRAMVEQGNGSMGLPNVGRPNSTDGGDFTNLAANPQGMRNMQQKSQELQQNAITGASGLAAQNLGMVRNGLTEQSQAEYKAQIDFNNFKANLIHNRIEGGGVAIAEMANPDLLPQRIKDVEMTRMMGQERAV